MSTLLQTIEEVYTKKCEIQEKAYKALEEVGFRGQVHMATGVGKSRLAILRADRKHADAEEGELLLIVPTKKLRDNNWAEEFEKWSDTGVYGKFERSCYVSVNKIVGKHFRYVIMDECHNITQNNAEFFKNNTVDEVIMMTATEPDDPIKSLMLEAIGPEVFTYTLEQGIEDGIIPPFWIHVVEVDLDSSDKYIKAGTKDKPFLNTEKAQYAWLTKSFITAQVLNKKSGYQKEFLVHKAMSARVGFISTLRSKTWLARCILQNIPVDKRVILFCGSIAQAEELLPGKTYHSETNDSMLIAFQQEVIDRLATVRAVNEGINIPNLDTAIIVQLNSSTKDMIQRLGRVVRWNADGYEPIIYIIVVRDTQDMSWLQEALSKINSNRIRYIGWRNFTNSLKPI